MILEEVSLVQVLQGLMMALHLGSALQVQRHKCRLRDSRYYPILLVSVVVLNAGEAICMAALEVLLLPVTVKDCSQRVLRHCHRLLSAREVSYSRFRDRHACVIPLFAVYGVLCSVDWENCVVCFLKQHQLLVIVTLSGPARS